MPHLLPSTLADKKTRPDSNPELSGVNLNLSMSPRLLFGVSGSILLFLGVFMPIISLPIIGNMNYFQNGKGDGVIILVLAGISLFLALTERLKGILIPAFLSLAVMGLTFFRFQWAIGSARGEMSKSDNPFKALGETMLDTVQLQWGWAVLIVGVGCLFAAAFMKDRKGQTNQVVIDRNNKGLYSMIASAVVITALWGLLVAVPQLTGGAYSLFGNKDSQTQEKSVKKDDDISKQRLPLLDALSVNITDKGFIAADFYAGRVNATISFTMQQLNKSTKNIRAYKGVLIFRDLFNDEITTVSYKGDKHLQAGQNREEKMFLDYNEFIDKHQILRSTEMKNLRVEWQPEMIMFSDGTSLGLNGEGTYSMENRPLPGENIPAPVSDENKVTENEKSYQENAKQKKQISPHRTQTAIDTEQLVENENPDGKPFDNFDRSQGLPKNSERGTKLEKKTSTPLKKYEPSPLTIRTGDGKMMIVNQ